MKEHENTEISFQFSFIYIFIRTHLYSIKYTNIKDATQWFFFFFEIVSQAALWTHGNNPVSVFQVLGSGMWIIMPSNSIIFLRCVYTCEICPALQVFLFPKYLHPEKQAPTCLQSQLTESAEGVQDQPGQHKEVSFSKRVERDGVGTVLARFIMDTRSLFLNFIQMASYNI